MAKIELLERIQKLADLVHGTDMSGYLSEETVAELRRSLDMLTEDYIDRYCDAVKY